MLGDANDVIDTATLRYIYQKAVTSFLWNKSKANSLSGSGWRSHY
jgi:hypothetical protein